MRSYDFNDTVSSHMCGHSVAYDFCNDPKGSDCLYDHGNHGAGATRSPFVGHDDRLTFVRMWPYDAAMQGAVTFFEDGDCKGKSGTAWAS